MKLKITLAVAALLTIGLSSVAAYADTITFTLAKPNSGVLASTGGIVTYTATVFAPATNGAAVFLNGDSFNVTAPVTLNDNLFFSGFPLSLAPGTSFTGGLFTLTVPPATSFGTFLGSFTLLGGPNAGAGNVLGTVNFSVATTPEPSSVVLMLTGMSTLLGAGLKRKLRAA